MTITFAGVWSNHFVSSFHGDDAHTIVSNLSIRELSNIPRFFTDPRTFSSRFEYASYQPLLSTAFALQYKFGQGADPAVFQSTSFICFVFQLIVVYGMFRIIPGGSAASSLFGAALYGLHPIASETLNYALRQGLLLASMGVAAGISLWIFWPRYLPGTLPVGIFKVKEIPLNDRDARRMKLRPYLAAAYKAIVGAPIPLYLFPVILALLADPRAAIFAPLLFVYVRLFEPETPARRVLPAAIVCGGYWILQTLWTLRLASPPASLFKWWATAPWVAVRYLALYFYPPRLTADSGFQPFESIWSPLALAGLAAVAALVWLAIFTGRRGEWRAVSFGIWWFLIALLPDAVIPQHTVEATWRVFLPSLGLVLAVSRAAWIAFSGVCARVRGKTVLRVATLVFSAMAAAAVLGACGWETFRRNAAWESEETLWRDAVEKNPRNGLALMRFGNLLLEDGTTIGYDYLRQAADLLPNNPVVELSLARACVQQQKEAEVETHFRLAVAAGSAYAPAYGEFSQWLIKRRRFSEALAMAAKALALDRSDLPSRHTLMDYYLASSDWDKLGKVAAETLQLDPGDAAGNRSLILAESALAEVDRASDAAKQDPSPESFLTLSVVYFKHKRYAESEQAAKAAQRLTPDQIYPVANLATIYFAQGRIAESIGAWREVLKRDPEFPSARNNLDYELGMQASK